MAMNKKAAVDNKKSTKRTISVREDGAWATAAFLADRLRAKRQLAARTELI